MPDGVSNTVRIPVATPEALLVMKAYALSGRDKAKDAYDIVFLIRHALASGAHLAAACHALEQRYPDAAEAYQQLAEKFWSVDGYGPSR
jgi:acyl carrier protein phosphodiesterase